MSGFWSVSVWGTRGLLSMVLVVSFTGCGDEDTAAGIGDEKDPFTRGVRVGGTSSADDPYSLNEPPDDGIPLIQPDNAEELEHAREEGGASSGESDANSASGEPRDHSASQAQTPGFSTGSSSQNPEQDTELDCAGMVDCMHRCDDQDQVCSDRCRAESTAVARMQGDEIQNCIDQHGCTDGHCVEEFCRRQLDACGLGDDSQSGAESRPEQGGPGGAPGQPGGGLTCDDVFLCFNQCPPNTRACTDACFAQGSPAAQNQVQAVGDCILRHQCQDDACVNALCVPEIEACEGDRAPAVAAGPQGELCGDGEDNDGNGAIDCGDPACAVFSGCRPDVQTAGHCDDPHPIEIGAFEGTTRGHAAEHCGECGIPGLCAGEGSEVVFALRVDLPGTYCIHTLGTQYDTVLHARQNNCEAPRNQVACNDDHRGVQSQIEVRAQAGVTYYVFMDSYQGGGDFVLNTHPGPCQ